MYREAAGRAGPAAGEGERCVVARDDLRQMESSERLCELDEKARAYPDDRAHKAALERQRERVRNFCS